MQAALPRQLILNKWNMRFSCVSVAVVDEHIAKAIGQTEMVSNNFISFLRSVELAPEMMDGQGISKEGDFVFVFSSLDKLRLGFQEQSAWSRT